MGIPKIHIGTSGWKYKHWDNVFYPETPKKTDQLNYYQQKLDTVELNNSFYREPTAQQFEQWKNSVKDGFLFAVKANRYFTHLKKLKADRTHLLSFLDKAAHLGEKLGPILFQLPPHWKMNADRLIDFVEKLPAGHQYAFEFRNPSWYDEQVYEALAHHHCAFCIYELAGHQSPLKVTANFVYVRLHGPGDKYQGSYSHETLNQWARQCKEWGKTVKEIYIYFDNDQAGYAAFNALQLSALLT